MDPHCKGINEDVQHPMKGTVLMLNFLLYMYMYFFPLKSEQPGKNQLYQSVLHWEAEQIHAINTSCLKD